MKLEISRGKAKEIITEWALKLNLGEVHEINFGSYSSADVEIHFVTEETKKRDAEKAAARAEHEKRKASEAILVKKDRDDVPL